MKNECRRERERERLIDKEGEIEKMEQGKKYGMRMSIMMLSVSRGNDDMAEMRKKTAHVYTNARKLRRPDD